MPFLCRVLDRQYASFDKVLDVFSRRCRYLTIESMTEKYMGKRPVSERTARFEECLLTPKTYFKYLINFVTYLYTAIKLTLFM